MGKTSSKIVIFTEDSYGKFFIKRLVYGKLNLKKEIRVQRLAGVCYTKSTRQIIAASSDCNKIVILVDGDDEPEKVRSSMEGHIRKAQEKVYCLNIYLIVVDTEIEEWVCEGLGICYGRKPSEDLNRYLQQNFGYMYRKSMLPDFASKVDPTKLSENKSFVRFMKALEDP